MTDRERQDRAEVVQPSSCAQGGSSSRGPVSSMAGAYVGSQCPNFLLRSASKQEGVVRTQVLGFFY